MIMPRYLPPNAYFDDPAANIDRANGENELNLALARETLVIAVGWIISGGIWQCSLRAHLVVLCICPQLLDCKRPSASWCARKHNVSRQWASHLRKDLKRELGDRFRFPGQRKRSTKTRNALDMAPTRANAGHPVAPNPQIRLE